MTPNELDQPFDPEKVERWEADGLSTEVVSATDYGALLAAYRALQSENKSRWQDVKKGLPLQGEENRVMLWLGKLKYPNEPHMVWGYSERGKWWCQWGELSGDKAPTKWLLIADPGAEARKELETK